MPKDWYIYYKEHPGTFLEICGTIRQDCQVNAGPASKKVCHKFYTIKRAFQDGNASPAEAHAAIVKQICQYTLSAFSGSAMIVVLSNVTSDCAKC